VTVNHQDLIDLLQAVVTGLQPKTIYRLVLAEHRSAPYGELEPRRKISLLIEDKSLKTVCFDSLISNQALKQTRSICLRAF
jgi:hypothetical protein